MADRGSIARSLPVVLAGVIGLLVGLAATYLVVHPDDSDASDVFDGPPSVTAIDRPAAMQGGALTGEAILDEARRQDEAAPSPPAIEPDNPRRAVEAFLSAELADRADESYALLAPEAQRRFSSTAAWRQSRSDRSIPQRFEVLATALPGRDGVVDVTVRAWRNPSITLFRSFVPAEATERWTVVRLPGTGWRLDQPVASSSDPQLPADGAAVSAAQRWVDVAASCGDASSLQVAPELLGAAGLVNDICTAKGTWRAEGAAAVTDLPDATTFVAAYGPGVGRWSRAVPVADGTNRLVVVLGPVGDEWRVLGLTPAR